MGGPTLLLANQAGLGQIGLVSPPLPRPSTVGSIWIGVKSPDINDIQGPLLFNGLDGCYEPLKWAPQNTPHFA